MIGGAGLVALGVGGYHGTRAMSRYDERQGHCNAAGVCDQSGADAVNEAANYAWIANAGVGVGLVGVGVGAYLLLSGSTSEAPTQAKHVELLPHVGENSAGLSVGGRW